MVYMKKKWIVEYFENNEDQHLKEYFNTLAVRSESTKSKAEGSFKLFFYFLENEKGFQNVTGNWIIHTHKENRKIDDELQQREVAQIQSLNRTLRIGNPGNARHWEPR